MISAGWWAAFGIPFAATIISCFGLGYHWRLHERFPIRPIGIALAVASTSLACGALWYVERGAAIPVDDRRVEVLGLALSIIGVVAGVNSFRPARWYSVLALGISCWMLCLYFLMMSTY